MDVSFVAEGSPKFHHQLFAFALLLFGKFTLSPEQAFSVSPGTISAVAGGGQNTTLN